MKIDLQQWLEIAAGQEINLFVTGIAMTGCCFHIQATNFDHNASNFDIDETIENEFDLEQTYSFWYLMHLQIEHTYDEDGSNCKWVISHYHIQKYRTSDNELVETITK